MIKPIYLFIIVSTVFFSSCTQHYYAPIMYRNSASYMNKPMSTDEQKSATYISGGVATGSGQNLSDDFYLGRLDIHEAHTFTNFNLAYGVYGFAGAYENTNLSNTSPQYFTDKGFYGFGAKFSANFFTPLNDHTDFRVIGIEANYNNESGDYAKFRKSIENYPGFHSYNQNSLLNVGLTSEIAWTGTRGKGLKHAVRGYLGTFFGPDPFYSSDTNESFRGRIDPAASYSLGIKNYFFVFDLQPRTVTGTLRLGVSF